MWTKPLAERRLLNIGMEKVARARLSEDNTRLEDVRDLADGAERRIQLGRDGNLLVTGADRFRFYDSDLDGDEHDSVLDPDVRRNFAGGVLRVGRDGSIPKDNPLLGRANVSPWVFAHGLKDPEGAAIHPVTGDLWVTDHGPQGGDEIDIVKAGGDYGWPDVSYGRQYDARQTDGAQERQGRQPATRRARTSRSRSTTGCRRSGRRGWRSTPAISFRSGRATSSLARCPGSTSCVSF